jgi:hypothetical protein
MNLKINYNNNITEHKITTCNNNNNNNNDFEIHNINTNIPQRQITSSSVSYLNHLPSINLNDHFLNLKT